MSCPLLSNSIRKGQRMMLYSCSQMVGLPAHMYLCSINWYCFVLFDSFLFPLFSSFSLDTKNASMLSGMGSIF